MAAVSYTGPLDLIAGAAGWYGLRAASAAKRGTVAVRLIRQSDGAHADISTDATTGILNTSDAFFDGSTYYTVEKIYDQSGNGLDLTNASADPNTLKLVLNFLGSLPAIQIAASGIGTALASNSTGFGAFSTFSTSFVFRDNTGAGWYTLNDSDKSVFITLGANNVAPRAGSNNPITANNSVLHRFHTFWNSASSQYTLDGGGLTGTDVGSNTWIAGAVNYGDATNATPHYMFELGIWSGDKSASFTAIDSNQNTFGYH